MNWRKMILEILALILARYTSTSSSTSSDFQSQNELETAATVKRLIDLYSEIEALERGNP